VPTALVTAKQIRLQRSVFANRWEKAELVHGMEPATTALLLDPDPKLGFRVSNGCGRNIEWPTQLFE
jgi:hypothetical protein